MDTENTMPGFIEWCVVTGGGTVRLSGLEREVCRAWVTETPMAVELRLLGDRRRDELRGLTNEYLRRRIGR
jgi:hypothetical protein